MFQHFSCDSIWSRCFPCLHLLQGVFQFLHAEGICHGTVSFFTIRCQNAVLCFLSDLLDALSGNMSGALFLVKVCKNICSSLLGDKFLFASMTVLLFEGLSLFSALVRFHKPVVSFSMFSDAVFSCQLFLVACVLALMYCAFALLCASTFAFVGELSLLLGLRPCAGCQALGSSRADSHGAFLLG